VFDKFSKYYVKILLGDFIGQIDREKNVKLAIGKESVYHQDAEDNIWTKKG
jgi:hypothetical protein